MDLFLNYQMKSSDGDELKSALESTIIEERQCIELFKLQIKHCKEQIININKVIATRGGVLICRVKRALLKMSWSY